MINLIRQISQAVRAMGPSNKESILEAVVWHLEALQAQGIIDHFEIDRQPECFSFTMSKDGLELNTILSKKENKLYSENGLLNIDGQRPLYPL